MNREIESRLAALDATSDQFWAEVGDNLDRLDRIQKGEFEDSDGPFIVEFAGLLKMEYFARKARACDEESE